MLLGQDSHQILFCQVSQVEQNPSDLLLAALAARQARFEAPAGIADSFPPRGVLSVF